MLCVCCASLCVSPVCACLCAHAWQEVLTVCCGGLLLIDLASLHGVLCSVCLLCVLAVHCVLLLCCVCSLLLVFVVCVCASLCLCCCVSLCVPRWLCACAVYVCALAASVYCVCANTRSVDRPRARPLLTVCCWCFCKIALSIDVARFFAVLLVLQFWETACACLCCACPRDFF